MDSELTHVVSGWAAVFLGAAVCLYSAIFGSVLVGVLWCLVIAVGVLVLIYAFVRFRVPEIIKFIKNKGWENEWTRSLGL